MVDVHLLLVFLGSADHFINNFSSKKTPHFRLLNASIRLYKFEKNKYASPILYIQNLFENREKKTNFMKTSQRKAEKSLTPLIVCFYTLFVTQQIYHIFYFLDSTSRNKIYFSIVCRNDVFVSIPKVHPIAVD